MPRNPESMRPTALSRTEVMVAANDIVIFENLRIREAARKKGDAATYERTEDFANGIGYETFRRNAPKQK